MSGVDDDSPLQPLLDTADEGLFLLDEDGTILWGNDAGWDHVGESDDLLGRPFSSLLGPDSRETDLDAIVASEDPTEVILQTTHGADVRCELDGQQIDTGQYAVRIREVTEAGGLEDTLELYRTVLDTVEDAIYVTDEDRRFTWVNAATERMFGYDREAILGRHLFEFLDEDQVAVAEENAEHLLAADTPDVVTFEMEVSRRDGTVFPAETRARLLPGDGFAGTVGIIRDVSDRNARKRELERKTERLEAFADTISHDIRNPLSVAVARLDLAREDHDSQHLRDLEEALDRIQDIVDDLYSMAKQGQQVDATEPTAIASVARTAWGMVPTGDATLHVVDDPVVDGESTRLQRAFENLFRNAVEHGSTSPRSPSAHEDAVEHGSTSPPSQSREDADQHAGPAVTVTVGALDGADGFYVEDDGPGIPRAERERVLEDGYTIDPDGTGFGLTIVEDIATAHGWTVEIRDGRNGGARFEFRTAASGAE